MRRLALLLALAVGLTWAAGCQPGGADDVEAVATVGDLAVGTGELADLYASTLLQTGLETDDPGVRDAVLESLVDKHLLVAEALDGGIEDTDDYAAARRDARARALVGRYTVLAFGDELAVTDADLRRAFVQNQTTYRARHLYARTRQAADVLKARLDAGETFQALARETFLDPQLRDAGGDLGDFGHDEMDPALEDAAFDLEIGEVSEPVRTAQGWSVVRVDARATNPLLTESDFATQRARLRRYVATRKRTEARFALAQRVLDELNVAFDADAMARLSAYASGTDAAASDEALAAWLRTPLVRFRSEHLDGPGQPGQAVWTVGDVEALGASATAEQRAAIQDEASLREFVQGRIVRDELAARARAAGLDDDPAVRRAVDRELENWIFADAKRRLRASIRIPDDTLRAHFAARAADYTTPERVRASEILVETRADADRLRAALGRGADFGDLARRHSLRPGAARADGDLGAVTRAQLGEVADAVWRAAPGTVVGPLGVAGRYALVLRGETVAPRPMTFAEARPDVEAALDVPFAQRVLAAHLRDLRRRYAVDVDRTALAAIRLFPAGPVSDSGSPARRSDRS